MPITQRSSKFEYDVIVIGSGIAGLFAAYKASCFARVCLLTKGGLRDSNTWLAQGGIAAALGKDDSPEGHCEDTLRAGAGLCHPAAVEVMVKEGPRYVQELMEMGTPFDREGEALALTREGAHRRNRVLHAGGDATGRLIQETLLSKVRESRAVTVREHTCITELLSANGRVCGVKALGGEIYHGASVILATGGLGQVFSRTTNPPVATGDGVAMAYRAGAEVADLEFIQFHPTAFQGQEEGQAFLVSEAVRGEGAVLRNSHGLRFMDEYHEMGELGPRDVVARAMVDQMKRHGGPVYLDMTNREAAFLEKRFPTILRLARLKGLNPATDWLPVAPAAHYAMGGVYTGLDGETSLPGLYACGEAACTGVHGANRLASNSLLEGLVFAARIARHIEKNGRECASRIRIKRESRPVPLSAAKASELKLALGRLMFTEAGVLRSEAGLSAVASFLRRHVSLLCGTPLTVEVFELQNLFLVAGLIVEGALQRRESRGAHFRVDYPQADQAFARHLRQSRAGKESDYLAPLAV